MIGAPTYEGSIFPTMVSVLQMAQYKRIHNKDAAFFGSYGWVGGAIRYLKKLLETLKWHLTETFEFAGGASPEDLNQSLKSSNHCIHLG